MECALGALLWLAGSVDQASVEEAVASAAQVRCKQLSNSAKLPRAAKSWCFVADSLPCLQRDWRLQYQIKVAADKQLQAAPTASR